MKLLARQAFAITALLCSMAPALLALLSIVLLAVFLALFPLSANALKFSAAMDPIRVEAKPGQTISRSFRLVLDKNEQRTQFRTSVQDWWRSEDGKQSFYRPPGTIARSCAPWIKLNPVEAAVNPGGVLDVRLTIAVPNDVKPGGYWCALTIDEVQDPLKIQAEGVGVRFLTSLSVGVFVYISPVQRAARILDAQVSEETAQLKVRNDGNCPLRVNGRFEFIRPTDGAVVTTVQFATTTIVMEPVNTTVLRASLPKPEALPSGRYVVRAILDIGLDHYIGVQKELEVNRGTLAGQDSHP